MKWVHLKYFNRQNFDKVNVTTILIMTVYKTNCHMMLTHAIIPYVFFFFAEFIRENTVLWLLHGATVTVHTPQRGEEQQQFDVKTSQLTNSSSSLGIYQWRWEKAWRWKPSLIRMKRNNHLSCHSHLISKYNAVNIHHWWIERQILLKKLSEMTQLILIALILHW